MSTAFFRSVLLSLLLCRMLMGKDVLIFEIRRCAGALITTSWCHLQVLFIDLVQRAQGVWFLLHSRILVLAGSGEDEAGQADA